MGNLDVKKLAKLTADENKVDFDIACFVLEKLGRQELLLYLRYLKSIANRKIVRVFSSEPISDVQKENISRYFTDREVVFEQKPIGDGIKVQFNDTIIDLSMNSYINTTIENLKQELK